MTGSNGVAGFRHQARKKRILPSKSPPRRRQARSPSGERSKRTVVSTQPPCHCHTITHEIGGTSDDACIRERLDG